ncbi:DUF4304 domain-containing protein [Aquabacterium sp. A7-Y]|uniref:DUF4304 domain-containing protein n=1 Tax=Aquabacterium sp. A7-Y TaxID=1349605 RepID=UPI00223DE2CE|nr:DUF4304 domain-containing protein [Aquabacterium sp. A7-Y]MCW7540441.1 DUF4304 domain-containing protein [Aquabacterium sp. A7-Y]
MPRTPTPPDADARIGKKIEYVARRLGDHLQAEGFERHGRTLVRTRGEGHGLHRQILHLQGSKWNEGSYGGFYVALSVLFPKVNASVATMPSQAWRADGADSIDEAAGQVRERLHEVLPPEGRAWPGWHDFGEVRIEKHCDLDALASDLHGLLMQGALPWFERHGRLEAVRDGAGMLGGNMLDVLCAAAWLGPDGDAERLLAQFAPRLKEGRIAPVNELAAWLRSLALDPAPLLGA